MNVMNIMMILHDAKDDDFAWQGWWLVSDNDLESVLLNELLVDVVNEAAAWLPAVHHPGQAEPSHRK